MEHGTNGTYSFVMCSMLCVIFNHFITPFFIIQPSYISIYPHFHGHPSKKDTGAIEEIPLKIPFSTNFHDRGNLWKINLNKKIPP